MWKRTATATESDGETYHERQKGEKQPLLEVFNTERTALLCLPFLLGWEPIGGQE